MSRVSREARPEIGWQTAQVGPHQYSNAAGPLIGLIALGVLVLLCRWVFSTKTRDERVARRRAQALAAARSRGDFGLLVPVATVRTADDAELLRTVLAEGGIRATVSTDDPQAQVVLVFRRDEARARALVAR
ncbi:MAG: hypothetical protein JWL64_1565 [Frankiales bacterium]|nr:hypothetical protein [Frankiales bacterium]